MDRLETEGSGQVAWVPEVVSHWRLKDGFSPGVGDQTVGEAGRSTS
ncbi:hypothetical protein GFS60_07056 (plasmid) [Rhodococcus sp. WAY2]|nr:hypothetical protein GFS60_07056 [Rhodococcus sp. WAY2]